VAPRPGADFVASGKNYCSDFENSNSSKISASRRGSLFVLPF
jgi:hypothetical protein